MLTSSFSPFADLPGEIQDLVWDICLEDDPPLVHFASLKLAEVNLANASRMVKLNRALPTNLEHMAWKRLPSTVSRGALTKTCRRSRAAVLRRRNHATKVHLGTCIPRKNGKLYADNRDEVPGGWVLQGVDVDASQDLVILRHPSLNQLHRVARPQGIALSSGLPHVRYLALPLDAQYPESPSLLRKALKGLLACFPGLRKLFFIIEPEDFAPSPAYDSGPRCIHVESGSHRPRETFRFIHREYGEIRKQVWPDTDIVAELADAFTSLRRERRRARPKRQEPPQSEDPMVLRIMTWWLYQTAFEGGRSPRRRLQVMI